MLRIEIFYTQNSAHARSVISASIADRRSSEMKNSGKPCHSRTSIGTFIQGNVKIHLTKRGVMRRMGDQKQRMLTRVTGVIGSVD